MTRHRDPLRDLGVRPSRLRLGDLVREAIASLAQRPGRMFLTGLGTLLGVALFTATMGLSTTARLQVAADFDVFRATEVLVEHRDPTSNAWLDEAEIPALTRLAGVRSAGRLIELDNLAVRRGPTTGAREAGITLLGAEPGALDAIDPRLLVGRRFDDYHEDAAAPVVLLSAVVADRLGVGRIGTAVFIGDAPFLVAGIYDAVDRRKEALLGAIVPYRASAPLLASAPNTRRRVLIEAVPGAAATIAAQAPLALRPQEPDALRSIAAPDPTTLRGGIETTIANMGIALGVIVFVVGLVSVANSTLVAIIQRTPEMGLRRAVGARPRHIFAQIVVETALVTTIGGLLGLLIGELVTLAVAVSQDWVATFDFRIALAAAGASLLGGFVAGMLPAHRATRISPVEALRR